MTSTPVYSTETSTAALGWDGLLAEDRAQDGLVLATHNDGRFSITLREFFSTDSPSGYSWEVSLEEHERCDDECRYELCAHGDNDRSYHFDSEAEARGKFSYLSSH